MNNFNYFYLVIYALGIPAGIYVFHHRTSDFKLKLLSWLLVVWAAGGVVYELPYLLSWLKTK